MDEKFLQLKSQWEGMAEAAGQWPDIEASVRQALIEAELSPEGVIWVIAQVKPIFQEGPTGVSLHAPEVCTEALEKVTKTLHDATSYFFFQVVLAYVKLWAVSQSEEDD
jgi:hypothetical protein